MEMVSDYKYKYSCIVYIRVYIYTICVYMYNFKPLYLSIRHSTYLLFVFLPLWMNFFSCPEQLNRWPCHSLTHSLTDSLSDFWFSQYRVTLETFDQSDEETWPDQKIYLPTYQPTHLPTYLPTCPPTLENILKVRF